MTQTLSFPNLGIELNINRVAFSIFGLDIYWYGIIVTLGCVLGYIYLMKNVHKVGIKGNDIENIIFFSVIAGFIGARIYYVIFQWENMFKTDPMKIFAFRDGGLAIYGGIIGSIGVGWILCRLKKVPFLPLIDAATPALILGQAIGRWGNFFNIEAFGGNTTLPWGMTSPQITNHLLSVQTTSELAALGQIVDPYAPVHPTFLYESLWNLVGFLILAFLIFPKRKFDGQIALSYAAWYGLGRAFIEGLRTDSLIFSIGSLTLRVSQVLSVIVCILAIVLIFIVQLKIKRSDYKLYVNTVKNTSEGDNLANIQDNDDKN